MKLFMPTIVYNEKNCVRQHSQELAALGSRALIVTGRHSSRINGSLDDVREALEREKIPYTVFDGIEENPSVDTVMRARQQGLREKADFVIGLGGGSPMDAAKAIALMIANPESGPELLYTGVKTSPDGPVYPALPVAAIPTTAGTGSEVTPYAILTRNVLPEIVLSTAPEGEGQDALAHLGRHTKQSISHHIFPALALVDVGYLQTASRSGCVNTAVDTLAHLIESQLNTNSTPYSRIYSEMGLRTWAKVKDKLLRYEIGEQERELLMQACTLGGIAIAHTGTSLPHGLSYTLTCELGTPHGKAVGIFLPGFLRGYGNRDEAMRVLYLLDFGGDQTFAEYIRQLLGEVRLETELWNRAMDDLLSNPAKLKNYPFQIDREQLDRFRRPF
ncbi:MAG: iron-containing alcohol dehydrogenase family protein [Eubacteriales bacterium]|nr:iron-containing alcohol dehydrogenase family protein [Eubacteriales bacterium]